MNSQHETQISEQQIVRRYAEDLGERTDGQEEQARSEELKYWLEQLRLEKTPPSCALQPLNDHAARLFDAWQAFQQQLSAEDRNEFENGTPSWEDVQKLILRVQASWIVRKDTIYGTAIARLRDVFETINVHQTFLRILPESNNYTSIFCGSILVLIKASATYRKGAEGLSRAIVEINDIVQLCMTDMKLLAGNVMREIAAPLYCHIFKFLERAMSWYTRSRARRFIHAFKEDAYEEFESNVIEIHRLSDNIRRRAQQGMHIESRTTNLIVQETRQDTKAILERLRILDKFTDCSAHSSHQDRGMFQDGMPLYLADEKAHCTEMVAYRPHGPDEQAIEIVEMRSTEKLHAAQMVETKFSLLASARGLRRHWEGCKSLASAETVGAPFTNAAVAVALQDWLLSRTSYFMGVTGLWQPTAPTSTSQLASAVCTLIVQAEVPIIHASCTPMFEAAEKRIEREFLALIDLIFSLIGQLIDILPEDFKATENIAVADLARTTESFAPALKILKTLLDASPSPLFCIIDNFQSLEHPAEDQNRLLTQLLAVFREHSQACEEAVPHRSFKVLFTTAGRSAILMKELEPHEMVLADQLAASRPSGRARLGRSPLSPNILDLMESLMIDE